MSRFHQTGSGSTSSECLWVRYKRRNKSFHSEVISVISVCWNMCSGKEGNSCISWKGTALFPAWFCHIRWPLSGSSECTTCSGHRSFVSRRVFYPLSGWHLPDRAFRTFRRKRTDRLHGNRLFPDAYCTILDWRSGLLAFQEAGHAAPLIPYWYLRTKSYSFPHPVYPPRDRHFRSPV